MKYSLKRFLKNIGYLFKYSLLEKERDNVYQTLLLAEEMVEYGEVHQCPNSLDILNAQQTIKVLIEQRKSFCRLGDGEVELILGNDIIFQKYDPTLAKYLLEILQSNSEAYFVGINYFYFHSTKQLNSINRRFYLTKISEYRRFLLDNCNRDRRYIDAGFNQLYAVTEGLDYDNYYCDVKRLLEKEDIVMFCGDRVFANIENNIFDCAKSIEYVMCSSTNAFTELEHILNLCRQYPKNRVLAFILGPTSKALVHVLSQEGYIAWDIGHLAKDYDYFMKGTGKNASNISSFFMPD